MLIRYGFDIELDLPQTTPVLIMMDVHPSRRGDIVSESTLVTSQSIPIENFVDAHGNMNRRMNAQSGRLALSLGGVVRDRGTHDEVDRNADQCLSDLPREALPFLMPSRYCETDLLSEFAWASFGGIKGGWTKVQSVCDFVNGR